jgi:hypothetical protein
VNRHLKRTKAFAIVGLMVVAVIILGALVMLHAAALVTSANTTRALEIARENAALACRLERTTREAAQQVYGTGSGSADLFGQKLRSLLAAAPMGSAELASMEILNTPELPRSFPDFRGPPTALTSPSDEFTRFVTPLVLAWTGPSARVSETDTFSVRYGIVTEGLSVRHASNLRVDCRLVAVPLTCFSCTFYELPEEVGSRALPRVVWPASLPASKLAPLGLVPGRDPADLETRSDRDLVQAVAEPARPAHYRYAAVLMQAYQRLFSQSYLQAAVDYAGRTHFVQIGAGGLNPTLQGGAESEGRYSLDVAALGEGRLGSTVAVKPLAVILSTDSNQELVLSDSGSSSTPVMLIAVGQADPAKTPLALQLPATLRRPIIIVGYRVVIHAAPGSVVNGALFLDQQSQVSAAEGPISVGHLSCWAGGSVSINAFRFSSMPTDAEALSPRALYVATSSVKM